MKRKDEEIIESRIKICLQKLVINYPKVNTLKVVDLLRKNAQQLDDQSKNLHEALKNSDSQIDEEQIDINSVIGPRKRLI